MAQTSRSADLTSGPMLQKIILFSIPLAASSILQLLFNAAEAVGAGGFGGGAAGFALPRYADLPQMGLYLDQTVQYVNSYFRTFCGVELTSSMVSNYVKKGILSHPVHKKYARDQIASLMYIAVSKTVLSMENIDSLFKMQRAHCSAGAAYDYFCDEMENCLPFVFGCTREIRDLAVDAADEKLLLRSTILAAANKMYLDCCFNALRQEENLWDTILPDLA